MHGAAQPGNWNLQQIPIGTAAKDLVFVWSDAEHTELHFTYRDKNGVIWDGVQLPGTVTRPEMEEFGLVRATNSHAFSLGRTVT